MAKQTIDLGTTPNRGDGDPLRTAFRKINENFDELYAGNFAAPDQTASDLVPSVDATYDLGSTARQWADLHISDFIYLNGVRLETDAGGNLRVNGSLIEANSQGSLFGEDSTLLVDGINNAFNLDGTVKGNIIPDVDEAYDIGSPTKKFRDLYLSGATIYLGNTPLSINNGTLLVDGVAVSGTGSTGDITFSATTISAPNQDVIVIESKDSNGFGTARVTLNSEFGGDARLRAFSSESVDTFTLANGDFATGVWQDNGFGNGVVSFTGAQGIGDFFQNTLFKLTSDNVTISINGETPFVWNGGANGSGTDTPGFGTNPIVPATPIAITSIVFRYRSESFISVNYDNQEIRLNAQNGSITFDANNTIQMFGDSNIELQSGSDFSINSGQNISIGTSSSDSISLSTGDLNFTAFDDVNFRGSDSFRLRNTSATASIRIITDDNNTSRTWAFNPNGSLTFPDNTIQTTAYTGPQTSLTGDVKGSVFADDSTLLVDAVSGSIPYAVLSGAPTIPADISDLTDTTNLLGSGTGDITFDGVKIQGAGTASGDGAGYSTLELVPDTNLYVNDQYLIIDPTAPSHIHIRAGGTQDASNAELYLGGEKNNVRVIDGTGVRLYNEVRNDTVNSFSDPTDFNTATWYGTPGNYFVEFTQVTAGMGDLAFQFGNDNENRVTVSYGVGESSVLTYGGSASNLGGGVYRFAVVEAPPASPTVLTAIEFQIWTTNNNRIELQNNDFTVSVEDDVRITGNDLFSLRNTSPTEPITIRTDYDGADRGWEFAADGTLSTPGDIVVNGDVTGTAGGSTLVLRAEPGSNTAIQLNDSVDSEIRTVADFEIRTDVTNTPRVWTFGTDGSLTFPDSTVQTTAYTGPQTTLDGDVTGSVFADNSTLLVDGVNGKIVGDVETARLRTTDSSIVLGITAGETNQGVNTIAIGAAAGQANQGTSSIAIGGQAGNTAQGVSAVALGAQAGATNQGAIAVSLGTQAGSTNQGLGAVAVGTQAGIISQGNYAVALGYLAGANNQPANSIVINASGSGLDGSAAGFYVNPVRNITGTSILQYNATTGEITHSNEISSEEDISIRINLSDSTQRVWRFGEDGILTLPAGGDIQDSTGASVLGGGGSGSVLEEPFESKTSATGVIEHDATTNRLFYHTSISANFTANFTNLGLAANEATSISLVLVQGATARMCTAVQIGGAAQTIVWQGSALAPTGNANRTDVVTFSILCTATDTYTVLGMLTSFGG